MQWHHNRPSQADEVLAEAHAPGAPLAAALDHCGNDNSKDRHWMDSLECP